MYPAYRINMVPELRIGGALVATGSPVSLGSGQPLTMTVSVPYDIAGVPVVWPFRPRQLFVGAFYAIPMSLEGVSEEALRRHQALLQDTRAAGLAEDSEPVRGESLYVLGLSYFNQIEASGRLDAALARMVFAPQMSALVTSQDYLVAEWVQVGGVQQPARIGLGSYGLDYKLGRWTTISASGDHEQERAFWGHFDAKNTAAEHAIIEQLQNKPAVSAIRVLDLANSQGVRVYRLVSETVEALLPNLDYRSALKDELRQYVASGSVVVVPQRRLTYNQWRGTGWLLYDPSYGSVGGVMDSSMVVAQGEAAELGPTKGGNGTVIDEIAAAVLQWILEMGTNVGTGCNQGCNDPKPNAANNAGSDPVDTTTGAFLHQTTDLAFGTLGWPIHFVHTYVSGRKNAEGPLGYGWTHSYALRLVTASDWARGLGYRTALDAVAAIAEAYVGLDLARAPVGELSLARLVVGSASVHWATSQVTNNVVTVTDPDGRYQPGHADYSSLVKNADGSYTVREKNGNQLEYNAQGRGTALVDANGNRTTLTYDGQGQLIKVTDAVGRAINLSYSGGRLTQIVDPAGRTFRYEYDAAGNLLSYSDALGNVTRYGYDAQRRLTTLTDAEGITFTTNEYDAFDRVVRQVDGRGGTMTLRYGDVRAVVTDALGYRMVYFYDRNQRQVGLGDAFGNRTTVVYDANDNIRRTTSRGGEVKSFVYDADGNLLRITDALSRTTVLTYDGQHNPVALRRPSGQTTQMAYDARHNLIRTTDPLGNAVSYTRDARGLVTSITDSNGHKVSMNYDAQGNLVRLTDALGHATNWTYDALGRVLSTRDALGHTTQYAYDVAGNLLRRTDPLGNAAAYTYDRSGLPASLTDARGDLTRYGYDAAYNLSAVADALGQVTRYGYDLNQRLIAVTDANGHVTRHARGALGRVVQTTDPLSRTVRLVYDADDRLVSRTRADGHVVRYEYDAVGQLTRTLYPDSHAVVRAYDADGRLVSLSDGAWEARYTYDGAGRLVQTVLPSQGVTLTYRYDPAGNRLALEARRGSGLVYEARYAYDAADRLTRATDQLSGYAVSFTYNADYSVSALAHSSGAREGYTYDAGGRALSVLDYVYDPVGNPTQVTLTAAGGSLVSSYTYDALDRLVREGHPRYAVEYAYDAVGNRTRMTSPLGTVTYSYDAADQLLVAGSVAFAYDAHGNQVRRSDARGTYTFAYDDEDRLTQITAPGDVRTSYRYEPAGRRIGVQGPLGASDFVYDGMAVILEGQEDFARGAAYLWARGKLAARRPLGASAAESAVGYLGDRLGSVTNVTDAAGQVRSAYSHDAYGHAQAAPRGSADPYRFVGQLGVRAEPALSDLYLMGLRYYDASTGRFLTRDPLPGQDTQPATLNRYVYALNNPLRYVDYSGLNIQSIVQKTPNSGDFPKFSYAELGMTGMAGMAATNAETSKTEMLNVLQELRVSFEETAKQNRELVEYLARQAREQQEQRQQIQQAIGDYFQELLTHE